MNVLGLFLNSHSDVKTERRKDGFCLWDIEEFTFLKTNILLDKHSMMYSECHTCIPYCTITPLFVWILISGLCAKICQALYKRYSKIDQQIARHFKYNGECLYHLLPVYATQIINPFLTSRFWANHDDWLIF